MLDIYEKLARCKHAGEVRLLLARHNFDLVSSDREALFKSLPSSCIISIEHVLQHLHAASGALAHQDYDQALHDLRVSATIVLLVAEQLPQVTVVRPFAIEEPSSKPVPPAHDSNGIRKKGL